jgi:phosphoribosylformimino-5-aminoimidazole carboxamide ribonucleotide (ProFAR) isomerase
MFTQIHVVIFWRTATKNKKLFAGGIQSESSRSNCHVANLDTTAKKTQCDGWKYQKALDRIAVTTFV